MFCSNCGVENGDQAKFCGGCGADLAGVTTPEFTPTDPRVRGIGPLLPKRKNAVLALVLSVIPGVGQFYNGDPIKGGVMMGLALLGSSLLFPWPVMCLWSMIDAYLVASGKAKKWG